MKKGFCFMKMMLGLFGVMILVSCGGGGGDSKVETPANGGEPITGISNAGSVTIAGNDIGAGEGVLSPTIFVATAVQDTVFRTWTSSLSAPVTALNIIFNLDGTIESASVAIDNQNDGFAERQYLCFSPTSTCSGITNDSAKKSITFNNTVLDVFQADATAPVTVNGTLKYTE